MLALKPRTVKVSDRRLLAACIKLKKAREVVTKISAREYQLKMEFLLRLKAEKAFESDRIINLSYAHSRQIQRLGCRDALDGQQTENLSHTQNRPER